MKINIFLKISKNYGAYFKFPFSGAEDADGQIHYENFIKELMKEKE